MNVCSRIDSAIDDLSLHVDSALFYLSHAQISEVLQDLRFLKMFFWCYENWEYTFSDQSLKYRHLASFVSDMGIADIYERRSRMLAASFASHLEIPGKYRRWPGKLLELARDSGNWECYTFYEQWLKKVDLLIPESREISLDFIHRSSLRFKSSTSFQIHKFLVTIHENLEDLFSSKTQMFVPVKEQIEVLQQKLKFFRDVIKFAAERCISHEEELKDFRVQVQAWATRVASLLLLYWADQDQEETVPKLKPILLHVLEIKPCTPAVKRMLLGAFKASKTLPSETFRMGNVVANSVDWLLEDLMLATMEDSKKMSLRDGLIILTTFLMDPRMEGNEILAKAEAVVDEVASFIAFPGVSEEKEVIPIQRYILVDDFLKRISTLKEEIREHYVQIQDLPLLDIPRTNIPGYVDFLLGNLEEQASSIIFAKFLILAMQEKLLSVKAYLKDLVEQQNEIKELKHLLTRFINGAYAVEHATDSCFSEDDPIWNKMICLSNLKAEIEFIMTEMNKIRDECVNNIRGHRVEMIPGCKNDKTSRIDESIVGFENEAKAVIDQLKGGSEELEIVSIVGMPGQGKTTLANKVYNDPSVIYHFHKRCWCFVSQAYILRESLLNILSGVTSAKDDMRHMSEEDLAEKLYRSLKGQRYLIALDDVWDIKAWDKLKVSFPNDSNGSRIMFTSRIQSIGSQAKLGSRIHRLCPLSAEESWKLLQKKLFHEGCCPPNLSKVGMRIVEICEGLPLSIVVTAGVLAMRVSDLDWWNDIEGDLSSKILGEGCKNIVELSYKHLPDSLKPCFLYFGVFRRGKPVKVKRLTQLWVAEGFMPKSGMKRPEDVAQEFLMDLIDRSLVIVTKKSSSMGIKECRVHDLLFDLCLANVKQDNFLRPLVNLNCLKREYQEYRICIQTAWSPFEKLNPTALYARTLLSLEGVHVSGPLDLPSQPYIFLKFKFLRVLHVCDCGFFWGFPLGVISLIHLRSLVLLGVPTLPPSIENLQNLEVLRVDRSIKVLVPYTIWKMKRLRHVHLRDEAVFSLSTHLLECAKLDNVETLSCPFLCPNVYGEELLRRFPNVRKLRIKLCEHLSDCRRFPVLGFLSKLESLNVNCPKGMHYPCGLKFPSTLKKLTLSETGLPWSVIPAIAELPNLEVLKLLPKSFVGERWDMEDEKFSNLKFLELQGLNIRVWNASTDHFPCLQQLVLRGCEELEEIPSDFGELHTLNLIEVRGCSKGVESTARGILHQQLGMGNEGIQVVL